MLCSHRHLFPTVVSSMALAHLDTTKPAQILSTLVVPSAGTGRSSWELSFCSLIGLFLMFILTIYRSKGDTHVSMS